MSWSELQADCVATAGAPWEDAALSAPSSRRAYIRGGLFVTLAMGVVLLAVTFWPYLGGWTAVTPGSGGRSLTDAGVVGIIAAIIMPFSLSAFGAGMARRTDDMVRLARLERKIEAELRQLPPEETDRRDELHALRARGRGVAHDHPCGFDLEYWLKYSGPRGKRVLVFGPPIRWSKAGAEEPAPVTDLHEEADLGELTLSGQWLSWGAAVLVVVGVWVALAWLGGRSLMASGCTIWGMISLIPLLASSRWFMPLRLARIASIGRVTISGLTGSVEFSRADSVLMVNCIATVTPTPTSAMLLRRDGRSASINFLDERSEAKRPEVMAALLSRWAAGRAVGGEGRGELITSER
jgi:MFS family permease